MDNLNVFIPIKEEVILPDEFIKLVESQRDNIESSKFIPPKIGDSSFGEMSVTYKHPVLKHVGK